MKSLTMISTQSPTRSNPVKLIVQIKQSIMTDSKTSMSQKLKPVRHAQTDRKTMTNSDKNQDDGGGDTSQELVAQPRDYIFNMSTCTGSSQAEMESKRGERMRSINRLKNNVYNTKEGLTCTSYSYTIKACRILNQMSFYTDNNTFIDVHIYYCMNFDTFMANRSVLRVIQSIADDLKRKNFETFCFGEHLPEKQEVRYGCESIKGNIILNVYCYERTGDIEFNFGLINQIDLQDQVIFNTEHLFQAVEYYNHVMEMLKL